MAHLVRIASVQFSTKAERGQDDARAIVLSETAGRLADLRGYDLDLVAFSEGVSSYGQTVDDAERIDSPGPFLRLYMDFAAAERCHVAGSVKLADRGDVYNSIAFVDPTGSILGAYHKVNLTVSEIETGLTSGTEAAVFDTAIGRLGGAICFDLNFEPVRTACRALRPDIVVFASMYHGGLMQQLWAYECRAFLVSALPFMGGGIIDPLGRPVALTDCYSSIAVATVNLDRVMVHLDYNRDRFADIARKYLDEVSIDIPPNVGSALITSHTDRRTARDVVQEFGIELLDDYFDRSIEANRHNRSANA